MEASKLECKRHAVLTKANLVDAAWMGHTECVSVLIQAGFSVNKPVNGSLPLVAAAGNGQDRIVDLLIQAGAKVSSLMRRTPLMEAALAGVSESVSALIEAGADVNAVSRAGDTPLIEAARYIRPSTLNVIQILLTSGAHVNRKNNVGLNALTRHVKINHKKCLGEEVTLLFAAGERMDIVTIKKYISEDVEVPICMRQTLGLKEMCRRTITEHLLRLDPHQHLFGRVPQLGLPPSLTRYVLYDMSLD